MSSLCILDINPYWIYGVQTFLYSADCLFTLLNLFSLILFHFFLLC